MPKYIDADDLKSSLIASGAIGEFGVYLIDNQPSVDVAPIVHGYWKPIYPDKIFEHQNRAKYYECSVCGRNSADEVYSNGLDYDFCPYCSAKMDMGGESHDP